jgi:competence protein ComEC
VANVVSRPASIQRLSDRHAPSVTIAPLVPLLLALAAGIVIDRSLDPCETGTWITLALASITVSCLGLRREPASSLGLFTAVLALGGAWNHFWWNDRPPDDLSWSVAETPRPAWVRGVVSETLGVRASAGYGPGEPDRVLTRMVVSISRISGGSDWQRASGQAMLTVTGDRTDVHAGQPVEAAGQLARVAGPLNPGEFDYRAFLRSRGIHLRLTVDSPAGLSVDPGGDQWRLTRWLEEVRASCRARLAAHLDSRTAPLASALILGQREDIDPEINDAFARTGTTHLLAISGLQLQALAVFLGLLLRIVQVPRRPAYAAVAVVTIGYSLLVGLAPSVVRSAVMTLTFCLAAIVSRPTRPANTLAMAGLLTLAWNPFFLFDVGCQLSFLAIAALIWLVPPGRQVLRAVLDSIGRAVRSTPPAIAALRQRFAPGWRRMIGRLGAHVGLGILASAVVWLAALPLVALRFHLVSPIGILLNIPLIPLTSIALLLGASGLGLGLVWEPLGALPIWAADVLLQLTEVIVRWGVRQPWGHRFVAGPSPGSVIVFYGLLAVAAVATWAAGRRSTKTRLTGWPIVLWFLVAASMIPGWLLQGLGTTAAIEGDLLAVGHGLAVSLRLEDGHTILYDCGRMGDSRVGRRIIAPALWSRGITRLDEVYLSHADQDHYNALPDLLDRFRIGEVIIPPGFVSPENPGTALLLDLLRTRGVRLRTIAAPATWTHGSTRFTVLHPPAGWHPETPDNARSLVLDVEHGGRHLLLTGDLDQLGIIELIARPRIDPPVELMLAPHHGGRSANPAALYAWARPQAVVVSQRMPAPGTNDALTALERSGIPLLRTWQRGAVHFRWQSDEIAREGFLDHHDQP